MAILLNLKSKSTPPGKLSAARSHSSTRYTNGAGKLRRGECLSFTLLLLIIHSFLLILHYNFKRISIDTSGGRLSGG